MQRQQNLQQRRPTLEPYLLLALHQSQQNWTLRQTQGTAGLQVGQCGQLPEGLFCSSCRQLRLRVDLAGQKQGWDRHHQYLKRGKPPHKQLHAPADCRRLGTRLLHWLQKCKGNLCAELQLADRLELCQQKLRIRQSSSKVLSDPWHYHRIITRSIHYQGHKYFEVTAFMNNFRLANSSVSIQSCRSSRSLLFDQARYWGKSAWICSSDSNSLFTRKRMITRTRLSVSFRLSLRFPFAFERFFLPS